MRERNKLKIRVIRSKSALATAVCTVLLAAVLCAGVYRSAHAPDSSGVEKLVKDYIAEQVKGGRISQIGPKQMEEITETVAVVLEERAAAGAITTKDLADMKVLIQEELLEKNRYLTEEDVTVLLEDFDRWAQEDFLAQLRGLDQRQAQLDRQLAEAKETLLEKAGQEEIDRLDESDGGLRRADAQLNEAIGEANREHKDRLDEAKEELGAKLLTLQTDLSGLLTQLQDKLAGQQERITGNETGIAALHTALETQEGRVETCFGLVSSAKAMLASTLTDKGVTTDEDADFTVINNQILKLYTKAFAAGADSVSGASAEVVYAYHHHVDGDGRRGAQQRNRKRSAGGSRPKLTKRPAC